MLRAIFLALLAFGVACGSSESSTPAEESAHESAEPGAGEAPREAEHTADNTGDDTANGTEPRGATDVAELPLPGPDSGLGVVVGVIRLAEGAEEPTWSDAALFNNGQEAVETENCPPPRRADRRPTPMGEGRGLAGVMIGATGARETFFTHLPDLASRTPVDHQVTIRECRLSPRLVVATRGDTLTIVNESAEPFLPSMSVGGGFFEAVLPGANRTQTLDRGGVGALRCPFSVPCGRSDVIVVSHPVHTVTREGGRFELRNVPADQEVTINAWHPLYRENSATVRVASGGRAEVEIVLTPAEVVAPEPPSGVDPGAGAAAPEAAASTMVTPAAEATVSTMGAPEAAEAAPSMSGSAPD